MSTPSTFKKAICRSADEVKSKEDKMVLVLLALNYSREIELDNNDNNMVDKYYDFLKETIYSTAETTETAEEVIKAAELDLSEPTDLVNEIKNNPAPISVSISEIQDKHPELKKYDWNSALSNPEKEEQKHIIKNQKVTPIPDAILYGDLKAYGISDLDKLKFISKAGDISDDYENDKVYDLGLVPRSFKLGNRNVVQHVDDALTPTTVVEPSTTTTKEEKEVEALEVEKEKEE